jgi:outer membrane protein assembly factor BamD (BamD/ComL family)
MRKIYSLSALILFTLLVCVPAARAQGNVKSGPDPATIRDPELEKDSLHNLEVARQYFKLKKAYVASLKRCEEVIAGNPNFAKLDEILFMAGESSLFLAENKGKQRSSLYFSGDAKRTLKPEEFRDLARGYLSQLVNDFPNSTFRKQAEDDLQTLGGPKPKESSKQ